MIALALTLVAGMNVAQTSRHGTIMAPGTWTAPVAFEHPLPVVFDEMGRSLELVAPLNAPIVAPMDGDIVFVGEFNWSLGRGVMIRHAPNLYSIVTTEDLKDFSLERLDLGVRVARGDFIGRVSRVYSHVFWFLFSYFPDSTERGVGEASFPSSDLVAEIIEKREHTFNVQSLISQGALGFVLDADLVRDESIEFWVNGVKTKKGVMSKHMDVLLNPGAALLRTERRTFFGTREVEETVNVTGGGIRNLSIGYKQIGQVGSIGSSFLPGPVDRLQEFVQRANAATAVAHSAPSTPSAPLGARPLDPPLVQAANPLPSTESPRPAETKVVAQAEPRPPAPEPQVALAQVAERERRAQEERQAEEQRRAKDEEEHQRLVALARQREQEAEAARQELARVREQVASAQKAAQAERERPKIAYQPSRRKALVIGNDAYTRVTPLQAARADARAMAEALSSVGFEVSQHSDLSERSFKQALREFKGRVQGGDEVVFFFAGHGVQIGGINYLLPVDIRGESEEQVRDEAIQLQRILDDMQERSAGFALAVVDACRDNPFRNSGRAIGGRGLAPTTAATGQMIIYSAGAGQQALDRLGPADKEPNGVFTRVFVQEMTKAGEPIDRVLRSVRQKVVQLARSVGREQTPALYDQAVGDFYFKP